MAIIKLSRAERKRISAFFTCVFLAMAAWIFVMMSDNYTFPIKVALTYKDQPLRKAFFALQADTVNALVSGSGWQKLFANITSSSNRNISVDLKKLDTQNFVVLSSQLSLINQKPEKSNQFISFNPDTVYFDFTARKVKRVPIVLQTDISYQQQYARSDDMVMKPEYVTISGPAAYVDTVKNWKTESLTVKKVNSSINSRLRLLLPKENNVGIYPKIVDVNIPVDEFTEKILDIPVKLINNRSYSKITLFPKKVKVKFMVSLNNYQDVNADFFEAVADFDDWQKNGLAILPVKLKQQPDYCKIISVQPSGINFIIRK